MNVILLSGGSGKRLWPLSNDSRSKQFLKLLQDDEGNYESMVQRVYRQLHESQIHINSIVIATTVTQQDSIRNQLGDAVEIVLEPERRNTFPAIALSCGYLAFEKKCSLDEVVVVLPVDPYADLRYFKALERMAAAAESGVASLVLMGIAPTYPSEKYGYITPRVEQPHEPRIVERFTEKPSKALAQKLIDEGAFWNGGAFAFKLEYIIELAGNYVQAKSYEDLRMQYCQLKKISFDYEVVEKASSVAMVSYDGIWKDLGTWNTLTEEMHCGTVGNYISVGEDSKNTHIINELNIPIVALGTKDLVIAASADGILVSDKERSSYLKPYVDIIDQRPMFEERRWGEYKVIDHNSFDGTQTLIKHMYIKAGKSISYHKHAFRDEIWTFINGDGALLIDGHTRNVRCGDVAYITKGQLHALKAITDMHFIEVQIGEQLVEEDIERSGWNW